MKNLWKSGLLLATIGLTVLTGCRRDGERQEGGTTSETTVDHLLIKEVFYTGSSYSRNVRGKKNYTQYKEDLYIKIFNPTSRTIYLDNYALGKSFFDPTDQIMLNAKYNFIKTHFGVSDLVLFGGNGTEHPLPAGDSILIAKKAVNHSAVYTKELEGEYLSEYEGLDKLLDLSGANYQWVKKEDSSSKAKEMKLWYKDDDKFGDEDELDNEDFDIVSSRCALALIELGNEAERERIKKIFLEEDKNKKEGTTNQYCKHISYTTGGHHGHNKSVLILPYSLVTDAVTICPANSFKWKVVDESVDKGHKGVEDNPGIDGAKAISRKFDGNKFVDDNNSTSDFEVVKASATTKK